MHASVSVSVALSVVSSHCMAMLHAVTSSGFSPMSWRSKCESSSCLVSDSAVNGSVVRPSVRLNASAAEFLRPARWLTLNLNWLNCTPVSYTHLTLPTILRV